MLYLIKLALIMPTLLLLQSCSTTLEKSQDESKTVQALYQASAPSKIRGQHRNTGTNSAYVRTSQNELENNFPMLPNPTLNMFIYPHLVNNSHPIPGYTTNFKLYKADQYALPGELH